MNCVKHCRVALAAIHYNANSERLLQRGDDGKMKFAVYFPKAKKGEAAVRPLKEKPTYGTYSYILSKAVDLTV